MDGVLFCEADAVGAFEGVEVGHEVVYERGGGGAAEEEGCFGVFVGEGLLFCEGSLRAGIFGFAVVLGISMVGDTS